VLQLKQRTALFAKLWEIFRQHKPDQMCERNRTLSEAVRPKVGVVRCARSGLRVLPCPSITATEDGEEIAKVRKSCGKFLLSGVFRCIDTLISAI